MKVCLFIFALGLCHAALIAADAPLHVATTPVPQSAPEWRERVDALNKLSNQKDIQIAFVGDSITEMWEADDAGKNLWVKTWLPLKSANFGVRGDRTEHVLWRLDHGNLDGLSPKLIILLIGTNNAGQTLEPGGYKCTPAQTADGIRAIIAKLKQKCPTSKILLLAIFPRGEEDTDPARKLNDAVNDIIKPLADSQTIFFLDIGKKFLKPNADAIVTLMPDMLHLSEPGYQIFTDAILPTVKKLLP